MARERPLKWGDLSPADRGTATNLLDEKSRNVGTSLALKVAGSNKPSPRDERALASPRVQEGQQFSLRQMTRRLVDRTARAATGPERLPEEPLAGTGFYFEQRKPLAEVTDDVKGLAQASSRLSPKTTPQAEGETARALAQAHAGGSVTFTPAVVAAVKGASPEHHGKTVPFKDLHPDVVNALRKAPNRDLATANSTGVDWHGLGKVGLEGNVSRAHRMLQGDAEAALNPAKNPKQFGYAASISDAVPDVQHEYMFRASHLGKTLRGEIPRGQQAIDTGQMSSNEGMLSNKAPIAADTWTRRAALAESDNTPGMPLEHAGAVADVFLTAKKGMARGDTSVTPTGIEHAAHQHAVENAATTLQRQQDTPFTVPSRLVQETGGWAQPRREANEDPQFNATTREREAAAAPPRNLNQRQMQMRLF